MKSIVTMTAGWDRNLGPESIRDICRRILGKDPRGLDKQDMSKLIEGLLAEQAAA